MYTYRAIYAAQAKPEGITKDKVPEGYGACDAVMICSILYPPDGSLSVAFFGVDGRTATPLADIEMFKVFSLLAHQLAKSKTLDAGRREFCARVFDDFCEALKGG